MPVRPTCSVVKTVDFATRLLGEDVVFTITVTNLGGNCASDVQVTDLLPAGLTYQSDDSGGAYVPATGVWTIGTLNAGASAVLHITATGEHGRDLGQPRRDHSVIPTDPVPGNNSSEVTVTVVRSDPDADPDLDAAITDPDHLLVGPGRPHRAPAPGRSGAAVETVDRTVGTQLGRQSRGPEGVKIAGRRRPVLVKR